VKKLILLGVLGLAGCQSFGDVVACDEQTRAQQTATTVQDTNCYTHATPLLGTNCTSRPRVEYTHNPASQVAMQSCISNRRLWREIDAAVAQPWPKRQ
jgi:hypothetical protein